MAFVLVFPLTCFLLSTGRSDSKVNVDSCYAICPRGYHKVSGCKDSLEKYKCKKCANSTFTDIENLTTKCQRCRSCDHYEVEIKPCSFDNDVECDCIDGYYNASAHPRIMNCQPCPCQNCQGFLNQRECQDCERCFNDPQCKRKCTGHMILTSTTPPAAPPLSASTTTNASLNSTLRPLTILDPRDTNRMLWLFLLGVLMTFLVLYCLFLHFTKNPIRYLKSCLCWSKNKPHDLPVQDPRFNEQCRHQNNGPATMTLNTSEETPILDVCQSPAKKEHPAGILSPPAGSEHKAATHKEHSEQWPATILYAIIKEVPLRRWKEFLRLLSVSDQQLERVELETGLGLGSMEMQYQMLRLWSQRPSASLSDVFSALYFMDLSGCAQLLQENLEKLQWEPECEWCFTECGVIQDT